MRSAVPDSVLPDWLITQVTSSGLKESEPVPLHVPLMPGVGNVGAGIGAGCGAGAGVGKAAGVGAVGVDGVDPHAANHIDPYTAINVASLMTVAEWNGQSTVTASSLAS